MTLSFELRRERHAIGEFAAILTFFKTVGSSTFASAVNALRNVASRLDLPAPMNMQVVTIKVDGGTPKPEMSDGAGWQRFTPSGEAALALFCDRDSIQLTCRDYQSWQQMLPLIEDCFSEIAIPYIEEVPAIKAFTLRYLNEFRSLKNGFVSASEMIKASNKWVAPLAFHATEPWHSHVGIFDDVSNNRRRLIHVNFNSILGQSLERQGSFSVVNATLLVGEQYDVPDTSPLAVDPASIAQALKVNFDRAHTREKEVLAEVFTDPYLLAMGANSKQ